MFRGQEENAAQSEVTNNSVGHPSSSLTFASATIISLDCDLSLLLGVSRPAGETGDALPSPFQIQILKKASKFKRSLQRRHGGNCGPGRQLALELMECGCVLVADGRELNTNFALPLTLQEV